MSSARAPDAIVAGEDRLVVVTLFLLFAIAVGNTTSGAVAQPAIGQAFDAGPADVGWIVFGYSGAFAVMTAVYGTLARKFGLARSLLSGVALVTFGSALAVVSIDLPMLVIGRVLQGLGAGAFPTLSMTMLARRFDGPTRARAIGFNVAAVGVGFALGPAAGGLALETVGWRGAVALGLLVAPAGPLLWRLEAKWDRPDPTTSLDLPGIALVTVAVSSLVLLLNRLPVLGVATLTIVAAGVLLVSGTALVRHVTLRRGTAFPRELVTDGRLWRLMLLGFVGQTAFLGTLVVIPIAAAGVHGFDGFLLGLMLLPMALVVAILSPRNGRLAERIGRPATTSVALTVIASGSLLLAAVGAGAPALVLTGGLIIGGAGFAFLNAPLANEVTRLFPGEQRSVALGIYNLVFFLGTASGSSLSTAFLQGGLELPLFQGRPLAGFSTGLLTIAAAPAAIAVVRWARMLAARREAAATTA